MGDMEKMAVGKKWKNEKGKEKKGEKEGMMK